MKNSLSQKLLATILSAALLLNSSAMAFATDEGIPGAAGEPIVTASETAATTEETTSTDETTTNETTLPGEDANESDCTCNPAIGTSSVEGHGKDCPLYVAPAQPDCTCPPVDSGEVTHSEDCPLYEKPAVPEQSEAVKNVLALIAALPTMEELEAVDTEAPEFAAYLAKLRLDTAAARAAFDALTDEDKAAFDADALAKLAELEGVLAAMPVLLADIPALDTSNLSYQNVKYKLTEGTPNGTATVSSVVDNTAVTGDNNVLTIPAQVQKPDGKVYDVTAIGNSAFYSCSALTSVTIPEGVTFIGNSAFNSCSALTSVTIPESVTTIGDTVFKSIKAGAVVTFEGTTELTNVFTTLRTDDKFPLYVVAKDARLASLAANTSFGVNYAEGMLVDKAPLNPSFEKTNEAGTLKAANPHSGYSAMGTYNVNGVKNDAAIETTYDNKGYFTYLSTKVTPTNDTSKAVRFPGAGVESYVDGVWVSANTDFVSGGNYLRVTYTLRNDTSTEMTGVSLGVNADVQIAENDKASIYATPTGFRMVDTESGMQFTLNCQNAPGADNVTTMWYGVFSLMEANLFADLADKADLTNNTDSALAFSWKNMSIPANGEITKSVLFGVGEAVAPPALPTDPDSKPIALYLTTSGEKDITVNAKVTDTIGVTDTLYYTINDGAEQTLGETVTADGTEKVIAGVIGADNFAANGEYTIELWIMNSKGAMSEVITKTLTVADNGVTGDGLETGTAPVQPGGSIPLTADVTTLDIGKIYTITNEAQLDRLATLVNGGQSGTGATIKLLNDVTANTGFKPIGTSYDLFNGTFDGGGFKVELNINASGNTYYQGLFGNVDTGGTVKNVGVSGTVNGGFAYFGGVAGKNAGTVQNCCNTATVRGEESIGGVVGYNTGTVQSCCNSGAVSTTGTNAKDGGGVVGYNSGTVQNCYNTAAVTGTGKKNIGGVVGNNNDSGTVQHCYNIGAVSGENSIGGVVGSNSGTVQSCYNIGDVEGSENIGGVVGLNNTAGAKVKNCVSLGLNVTDLIGSTPRNFGRVVGSNSGGTLTDNRARSDMKLMNGPVNSGITGPGQINGENFFVGSSTNQSSVFYDTFSVANGWNAVGGTLEDNALLPTLAGFTAATQSPTLPAKPPVITILVDGTAAAGGISLEEAFLKANVVGGEKVVKKLAITAGAINDTDVAWFMEKFDYGHRFKSLTHFKIYDGVSWYVNAAITSNMFPQSINEIDIPQAKTIGGLKDCINLNKINFPSVTKIGIMAFKGCSRLTEVDFPSAETIGDYAFQDCRMLKKVSFPNLGGGYSGTIPINAFENCALEKIGADDFPTVTKIEPMAFQGCEDLISVSFPKVKIIGESAFRQENTSALSSVEFPNVTKIEKWAFRGRRVLTSVSFPKVESIGEAAFSLCSGLKEVSLTQAVSKISIGHEAFDDSPLEKLTLYGGIAPEIVRGSAFGVRGNELVLVDKDGAPMTGDALTTAIALYKAVADGSTTDNYWYRWPLPEADADPVASWAATGGATGEGTLTEALAAVKSTGGTVTLLTDVRDNKNDLTVEIRDLTNPVTLVLNGKTIYGEMDFLSNTVPVTIDGTAAGSKIQGVRGMAILSDSHLNLKLKGGTYIGAKDETTEPPEDAPAIMVQVAANKPIELAKLKTLLASGYAFEDESEFKLGSGEATYALTGNIVKVVPAAPPKITITVNGNTTEYGGADLKAAVAASGVSITTLTVTAGTVTETDWKALKTTLPALTTFEIDKAVETVANIPVGQLSGPIFPQSLISITIPQAITVGEFAFSNLRTRLTTVNLSGATKIDYSAFYECDNLATVTLNSVTEIGGEAFYGCEKLKTITLPKADKIGFRAFHDCTALSSVALPVVTSIGEDAFYGCTVFATMKLPAKPPAVVSNPFSYCAADRSIAFVNATGNQLAGAELTNAQAAYDDITTDRNKKDDGLWYGWKVRGSSVTVPVTGVSLNKPTLSLEAGKSEMLTATVAPANATNKAVTWQSSAADVATVDENGKVTAVAVGSAIITVTTTDGGKTATCAVTVTAVVTKPAPGGKLEAPLTQDKVNDVFGEGNATLDNTQSPPKITIDNSITPEKPIEIETEVTIDLGGNTITGKPGQPPIIVGDGDKVTVGGGGTVSGGDNPDGAGGNGITGGTDSEITIGGGVTITGGDGQTGGSGIQSGGNVTVDGSVTGGNGSSGNGGDGVDASGDVTIKPDGNVNGGNGATGGDGINSGGNVTVDGSVSGGNGSSGNGGTGVDTSGGTGDITIGGSGSATGGSSTGGNGNGGNGTTSGGNTTVNGDATGGSGSGSGSGGNGAESSGSGSVEVGGGGSATGGAGGNTDSGTGGSGGNGTTTGSGSTEIGAGGSASGGNGGAGSTGGNGGNGSTSTGSGNITNGGSATGGNGGSGAIGGNGGNGTTTGGNTTVNGGGSSTGGTGGSGSTTGGNGGNGTNSGSTTVNGGATGGSGGSGTSGSNGSGGNGGDGANQGNGTVDGTGTAIGGNGGSSAGTGTGGNGGSGVGGGATPGDNLIVKNGISAKVEVIGDAGTSVVLPDPEKTVDAVLTKEEKADPDITDVKVTLKVDDKTAAKPDQAAVEAQKPAGSSIGAFFDITLLKTITGGTNAVTDKLVTNTSGLIKITIEIPSGMRDGEENSYVVIRVHNGTAETLATTQSGNELTFETDKFSTYAIAYTKSETPPAPPSDNTGGGGSSSNNGEYDFWMTVKEKIQKADSGDVVKVNAKGYDKMPWSVMDVLRKNDGVSLVITWNGKTITIPAGKAQKNEPGRIYWPLSKLAELYEGLTQDSVLVPTNPETGGPGKYIPVTGGGELITLEAPSPAMENALPGSAENTQAITPTQPKAITPPDAGFEKDAFVGTPDNPQQATSDNTFAVIALMLAAAAVGGGVWFWKKRQGAQ